MSNSLLSSEWCPSDNDRPPSISWHFLWRILPAFSHYLAKYLFYPIAFVAGWIGIHYQRWRKQRAENAAQGWPSVNGRITSADFKEIPKTSRYLATLHYSYFLGEYRVGTYVHEFSSADDAGEFVRVMKDKEVPIRYKESNPNKSVLEQSTVEQHIQLAPRFG
jgi:peptidoglycan/xylan/chitin deacetylase (PgdA/CDA1 family)